MFAGEAWQFFTKNPDSYIPSYSGLKGQQGLKYTVISDLNCLFKNELLGYEWRLKSFQKKKPDFVRKSFERMGSEQQQDVQQIAKLILDPDKNFQELWKLYQKNIGEPNTDPPDFN